MAADTSPTSRGVCVCACVCVCVCVCRRGCVLACAFMCVMSSQLVSEELNLMSAKEMIVNVSLNHGWLNR